MNIQKIADAISAEAKRFGNIIVDNVTYYYECKITEVEGRTTSYGGDEYGNQDMRTEVEIELELEILETDDEDTFEIEEETFEQIKALVK